MARPVMMVTGGTRGIGAATALMAAQRGYDLLLTYRSAIDRAEATARACEAAGARVVLMQGDAGAEPDILAAFNRADEVFGRLDVLVNNAGIFPRVEFLQMTEAQWDAVLDVNLKGSAFCAQAAARHMVAAGIKGVIINLSSSSVRGAVLGVHYSATKTGVIGITRSMALALAPHGIRVNAIAPGLTDTAQPRYGNTDEELAEMAKAMPLGRMGRPEEIAGMMTYLASAPAAWITGQVYHINGGVYLA